MTADVVCLAGPHRSRSNFVGRVLEACGCATMRRVVPTTSWNPATSDDPHVLAFTSFIVGTSEVAGLPGPERPVDPESNPELPKFRAWVRSRFEMCRIARVPYLLKCNVLGLLWESLLPAFPPNTRFALVTTHRDPAGQLAGLQSVAKRPLDPVAASAYITAIDAATREMIAAVKPRGWPVFSVTYEALGADHRAALEPIVTGLGLTASAAAWEMFDPDWRSKR